MPPIIPATTTLEKNKALLMECILAGAEAAHNAASVMRNVNERIWSLPTAELLELLNHDVPRTLEIFAENTAIGKPINARLNKLNLPQFPTRAPTSAGRTDIVFDQGTGKFVHNPPPPDPEPGPPSDPSLYANGNPP